MIRLNPLEATPTSGAPLCLQCKLSVVTRDERGATRIRCNLYGRLTPVTTVVQHCTAFYPHNEPWLHEYEALAWVWSSDAKGSPAFIRMRDLLQMGGVAQPVVGFGR